jgi:flagellar hook-length control protein FliK
MLSAGGPLKSGGGAVAATDICERFLRMMQAARNADAGLPGRFGRPEGGASAVGEGEKGRYLERLKEALVKQGRPLSRTFLAKEDLPLLGVFLQLSGFSEDQVQRCMTMLTDRCRDGRLSLSDFFQAAAVLKTESSAAAKAAVLDAGVVPRLEGVLRQLGFGVGDVSEALAAARVQGGGVDPGLLIQRLRKTAGGPAADMQADRLAAAEAVVARLKRAVHAADAGPNSGGPASRAASGGGLSNPADGAVDRVIRDILQQIRTDAEGMVHQGRNHLPLARVLLNSPDKALTDLPAGTPLAQRWIENRRNPSETTVDAGLPGRFGRPAGGASAVGEGEKGRCLERLKEALVKQGRPLSRTFLAKEDLPLLGVFLQLSGFSEDQVQRCMTMLTDRCRDGRLSLSDFFQAAAVLKTESSAAAKAAVLDAGVVPRLEGVLRQLGFGVGDVSEALAAARVQGGGVDPGLLIQRLRKTAGGPAADMQADRLAAAEAVVARLKRAVHAADAGPNSGGPASRAASGGGLSNPADGAVDRVIRDILQQIRTDAEGVAKKENHIPSARLPLTSSGEGANGLAEAVGPLQGGGENGKSLFKPAAASSSSGPGPHPSAAHDRPLPAREATPASHFAESGDPSLAAAVSRDATPPVFTRVPARPPGAAGASGERLPAAAPENGVPSYVVSQVGRQLARSLAAGDRVVELRLKPPELGGVRIQMDMQESGMKLSVMVENKAVRDLLHPHLHELRELLLGQGVKVDRLDVTIQPQTGPSLSYNEGSHNEGFQEQQPQPRAHRGSQQGIATVDGVEEASEFSAGDTGRRLLDVTA